MLVLGLHPSDATDDDFEYACSRCEVNIRILDEAIRRQIIVGCGLAYLKEREGVGRTVTQNPGR